MEYRKDPLTNNKYYHIVSRSIAKMTVFGDKFDYERFVDLLTFYRYENFNYKYSNFSNLKSGRKDEVIFSLDDNRKLVDVVAYTIMPDHIHLILKQNMPDGITKFMSKVLNSYTRYYNSKHFRIGPLWEGHFKNVLLSNHEQILHLSRFIHLNPVQMGVADNPLLWMHSSLSEYLDPEVEGICEFKHLFDLETMNYKSFLLDQKPNEIDLEIIKEKLIDHYIKIINDRLV